MHKRRGKRFCILLGATNQPQALSNITYTYHGVTTHMYYSAVLSQQRQLKWRQYSVTNHQVYTFMINVLVDESAARNNSIVSYYHVNMESCYVKHISNCG